MNFKLYSKFVATGLFFGITSLAQAVTINFENTSNGVAIGEDFITEGVVFTNAFYASSPYLSQNGSQTWASGESDTAYNQIGNVAITGYFIGTTDFINAEIIYADNSTTSYLDVYDSNGIWMDSTSMISTENYSLSIAVTGIASFVFSWARDDGYDDTVGIDNFTFNNVTTVPIPPTALLLFSGLISLISIAKRKTSAKN